jgi:spermidine synthase
VIEFAGTRSLAIDGKVDGSTGGDMLNQELAAHLPLLLHERPRDVLVIGLGTGVTLGAAAAHPADRIDIVEISPEVVRASAWFREQNGEALSDPRVHLIVGDARSHLTMTNRTYDVIVSEPSNPWIAGVAALFTQEAFSAIKSRLAPGGIACQWVHTYDISEADLRSIIGTFAAVFPNGTIWMAGEGDLLLVSSNEPLDIRLASITDSWKRQGVVADLKRVGVLEPFGVLSLWGGGPRTLASIGAGVPLQTDDRMALEFSGPLAVYRTAGSSQVGLVRQLQTSTDVPALIERARADAGAAEWRDRAAMLRKIHAFDAAYTDYAHAFSLGLFDDGTVSGLAQTAIPAGTVDDAVSRLTAALKIAPSSSVLRVALSKLHASVGHRDAALATAQAPDGKGGDQLAILEQLAALYADSGDAASLARVVEQLQTLRPEGTRTRYYAAAVRFMQGAFADALAKAKLASDADADPSDIDPLNLTGDALASMGRFDEAQTAFEAALKRAPTDPTIYVNLGLVALSKGDASRAEKRFAAALTLDPTFRPAAEGLAQAKQTLGSRP